MFRKGLALVGMGMVLFLVACGTSDKANLGPTSTSANQETAAGKSDPDMMTCPKDMMKDVTLTLTDTPTGITVDFVTTVAEKVDMLRMMAKHMADMHSTGNPGGGVGTGGGGHERHHGSGSVSPNGMGSGSGGMGGHNGMGNGAGSGDMMGGCVMGNRGGMGKMTGMFQGATIEPQDIEGGARLVFAARNSQKVDELRAEVRSHFQAMQNGQCPMMSM